MSKTAIIKLDDLYIKREDHNPTGSAKDRALSYQVENLRKLGFTTKAVISSTGNAAISASYFCQKANIDLTIFLSPKINPNKLKLIKTKNNHVIIDPKPISSAFKFAKKNNAYFLRQSTDPSALEGYAQIGQEIIDQLPQVTSIFIPVGSGTTLLGISQKIPKTTKLFAVQPANNPTISKHFDHDYLAETTSLTDSLSVKFLPLKQAVISAINKSGGGGLVITDSQIKKQLDYLESNNISTSPESAMALAGLVKARSTNIDVGSHPLVIFTGTNR